MSCDSAHKTIACADGRRVSAFVGGMGGKGWQTGEKSHGAVWLDKPLLSDFAVSGFVQPLSGGGLSGKIAVDDWTDWTPERTAKKQGWTVMMDSDPLKLTIFTGEKGYRGREVAEVLRAHEVECEFADLDAVVLMATPENTERDFQRIEKALERLPQKEKIEPSQMPQILPKQKMRDSGGNFRQMGGDFL